MRIYKLYADVSGSANNAAAVTIVRNSRIVGITWNMLVDGVTDNGYATVELSLQSSSFINVNDTAGPISQVCAYQNFATSGLNQSSVNFSSPALNIAVGSGEKLYLNANAGGTIDAKTTCFVYVEEV